MTSQPSYTPRADPSHAQLTSSHWDSFFGLEEVRTKAARRASPAATKKSP